MSAQSLSHVRLFVTPWTVASQAPLPVEILIQKYWGGMPFPTPRESSQPRDGTVVSCMGRWILYHHHNHLGSLGEALKSVSLLSCVCLFETPWTVASQAPLSIEFSRQEYCSGLPFPSSTDLSSPGIEPGSPELQADSLPSEPPGQALLIYSDHTI